MASETVDPIDWSHPPPSWAVPHERLVHSINQCTSAESNVQHSSMRGNHLAYAATQGIASKQLKNLVIYVMVAMKTVPMKILSHHKP